MDVALDYRSDGEYDEGAFLYFLNVERSRAHRSDHSLRLLLVSVEPSPGKPVPMQKRTATRLFAALADSLRDTDVMGWYRQGRMAAAVLAGPGDGDAAAMTRVIRERVTLRLCERLPSTVTRHLRLRVIQLRRPVGNK